MSPPSDVRLFGRIFTPAEHGLGVVTVEGGQIRAIEPASRRPRGAEGGPTYRIVPGLIDIQVNGAFGQDFSDPCADLVMVCGKLPRFGVTAFLPTVISSPPDRYRPCLENLKQPVPEGGAVPLGAHVEGPFLSPARPGTHDPATLRDPDWGEISSWLGQGNVRIVTLAPERPGAIEAIRKLTLRGVVVSIGHTDATWSEAAAATEAGARLGTHLFNAMRPFSHRDPGVAGFLLTDDIPASFIADGIHLAPETLQLICRVKRPRDLVLITDALAGLGLTEGAFELAGQQVVRDGPVARRPDGTLSGSLLSLNLAIANLARLGVPEAVAIAAATVNPARLLRDRDRGVLHVGGRADIALLDDGWNLVQTLVDGRRAFPLGAESV
jgi:N-acetylglucosamine-6-phosphate deacetylase